MRITKLELHGFKSFADRTVFHFGSGISCVVGPNGCGKSNVVDSLKWVVGEQSAKSLRGGEMMDVIFAGSADRKPVGYAEVGLTLTSEDGEPFPGEYAKYTELQVARRLYRSGASEYLINQARVRRKDIVDLLMDSGVGNNLYSFIEQGRIGKIVNASPEERRGLIDEAAGITRYKQRRKEARSKLEATAGQLDRAADVADEMGRRLRTLERQVIKAARFRRLRALVRQEETFLSLVKLSSWTEEQDELVARVGSLSTRVAALEDDEARLESDLAVRAGELEVAEAAAELARDNLSEAEARRREADATRALQAQRAAELEGQLQDARAEAERDAERAAASKAALDEAEAVLGGIGGRIEQAEIRATEAATRASETRAARDAASDAVRGAQLEAGQVEQRLADLTAREARAAERLAALPERRRRIAERLDAAAAERVSLEKRAVVAEEVVAERKQRLEALDAEAARAEEALESTVRADVHARDAVKRAQLELDESTAALDEVVAAVEASSGLAEEEVRSRVAVVRQREDNALREAERTDLQQVSALEAASRRRVDEAATAARSEIEDAERRAEQELATWRTAAEAAFEREDAERAARIDALVAGAGDAVSQAESEGRQAIADELETLRSRREAAEAKVESAKETLANIDARRVVTARKRHEIEGRIAALRAEETAHRQRDAGAAAVAAALPEARTLVDLLGLSGEDADRVAARLGERLVLPVVSDAASLRRAVEALSDEASATVLFKAELPSVDALVDEVSVVEGLEAAVAAHQSGAAPVVDAQTGARIEPDGVVRLGRGDTAARAALDRRAELDTLEALHDELVGQLEAIDQEALSARAAIEGARITARKHAERAEGVERERRGALETTLRALREERERDVVAARQARVAWRDAQRRTIESELSSRLSTRDAAVEALRGKHDERLAGLRADAERELADARAAAAARHEERRSRADAVVEEARATAWEEVRRTTADTAVRRDRLREEVDRLRKALERARHKAEATAEALRKERAAHDAMRQGRGEHELVIVRMEAEATSARSQQEALVGRRAELEEESRALQAAEADTTQALEELRAQLREVEAVGADAGGRLAALRARLEAAETDATEARAAAEATAATLAELRERRAAATATVASAGRELEASASRAEAVGRRIAELEVWRGEAARTAAEAAEQVGKLSDQHQVAATRYEAARERFTRLRSAREELDESYRRVASELADQRHQLVTAEQALHQLRERVSSLIEQLDERYQIDLPALLSRLIEQDAVVLEPPVEVREGLTLEGKSVDPVGAFVLKAEMLTDEASVTEYVERIEEHREKLGRIGDVNLGALDEYTDLKERFDDLDEQRTDLDSSVASIKAAIAKMNRTCRERFRDTFDRVNEAFQSAYPKLVGGGEARLELTDQEDLLETGVEIFVRPPGKRLQNLQLLSGGEKAMTAIALLLALFTVKPSPFCVLDEVDAPLDEANGARFNDMIRQMASMTQFIVITHNRKTMECADTLYGVTMPTPGCSALVSVKVDD